jgi:predicted RNA-binding Zn ribbon-like protein
MADPKRANTRLVPAPRDDLCVEFAGTRRWRGSVPAVETLHDLGDLVAWCADVKAIDRAAASELTAWASRHGRDAARLFDEALAARETIYAVFSANAGGDVVAGRDVDALNRLLAEAPGRTTLATGKRGTMWRLPSAAPTAASLLAPILWSAGDLLTGERLQRVRMCANEKCRWLFLDDSKSGTRRWCSMRSCGNRAKAHRHYMRTMGAPAEAADDTGETVG